MLICYEIEKEKFLNIEGKRRFKFKNEIKCLWIRNVILSYKFEVFECSRRER